VGVDDVLKANVLHTATANAPTEPVYYNGNAHYWYRDRWYYRNGRTWAWYRGGEPGYLHDYRFRVWPGGVYHPGYHYGAGYHGGGNYHRR